MADEQTKTVDVSKIHAALDTAETAYKKLFEGHVPDEHHRFESFLATVRMIVDQSADRTEKGD